MMAVESGVVLVEGSDHWEQLKTPSVVTIGNFDGVHVGHQRVIETLVNKASELGLPSVVLTFDPLAKEFFQADGFLRLQTIAQRESCLKTLGVDFVFVLNFSTAFSELMPVEFVESVLVEKLNARFVSVGDDFRFGNNREGDFAYLLEAGKRFGFDVMSHDTISLAEERVSSFRVRNALREDNLAVVNELLGRNFSIAGEVEKGRQLGRELDFPTANVNLNQSLQEVFSGVYAVRVKLADSRVINGVANAGARPTVGGTQSRVEAHLFDFDEDIYGQEIEVFFVEKLREEHKFDSLDELKQQIAADAEAARTALSG